MAKWADIKNGVVDTVWLEKPEDRSDLIECGDNVFSGFIYKDGIFSPSVEEEVSRMTAERNRYKEFRAAEYPSFADQFDLLYHGGYDAWRAAVQSVKDKYPKV
jgi:hypothetical protein